MSNHADIFFEHDEFVLSGDLDFQNVLSVFEKGLKQFNSQRELVFNFAGLKTSNSAAIALMVEWLKRAKQQNKSIQFRNVSPQLQSIAKVAGLEKIILY